MQAAVKQMAGEAGLDLALMPSCIVNQAALAIDARSPVQLVESIEQLIGTWPLRAKLADVQSAIDEASEAQAHAEERVQELAALRLRLRPEVEKLLKCNNKLLKLKCNMICKRKKKTELLNMLI